MATSQDKAPKIGEVVDPSLVASTTPIKSGLARKTADLPLGLVSGALGATASIADAFGADNVVARGLKGISKGADSLLSPEAKVAQMRQGEILDEAKGKGFGEQLVAGGKAFMEAPLQTTVHGVGSVAPFLATSLIPGGAAATAARVGMGLGMGAGAVKGSINEEVTAREIAAGKTPEQAAATAEAAQAYGGKNTDQIALGAGLGVVDAAMGVTPVATKMLRQALGKEVIEQGAKKAGSEAAEGMTKAGLMGAAKEMPVEFLQGGQEQVAANIAAQREGYSAGTFDGAFSQGALEALASAGPGAGFGIMDRSRGAQPVPPPEAPSAPVQPAVADQLGQSLTGTPMSSLMAGGGLTGAANPLGSTGNLTTTGSGYPGMNTAGPDSTVDPETGAIIPNEPGIKQWVDPNQQPVAPAPLAGSLTGASMSSMMGGSDGMTGAQLVPIKPSEQMGLNPNAGPLSAAAVSAVDGGAAPSMQAAAQATSEQEQAAQAQQQADDKRKSSGWTMNEYPVGDEPMVASLDSKDQPLFMTQAGETFNVRDADWNVIATGNSFEEAAGRAKVQQASGGKAVQLTTGATDGATPTQAQQTSQKGQAESETDWSMGAAPIANPPGSGFQDSTAKRAQGLKAIRERNGLNKPAATTATVAASDVATAKTDTAEQPGTTGEGAGVSQPTPLTTDARKRNLATLKQRMMAGRKQPDAQATPVPAGQPQADTGAVQAPVRKQAQPQAMRIVVRRDITGDEFEVQGSGANGDWERQTTFRTADAANDFLKSLGHDVGTIETLVSEWSPKSKRFSSPKRQEPTTPAQAEPVAAAVAGQPEQAQSLTAQKPVEESQQDKSLREWTENYDRVSNTDDLSAIADKDLIRADTWASRKKASEQRKGWDGGEVNQNLVASLTGEIDRIKAEQTRRASAPVQKPGTEQDDRIAKALDRVARGSAHFAKEGKAKEWITANGLTDTHIVERDASGANKWNIVAKKEPTSAQATETKQAETQRPEAPAAADGKSTESGEVVTTHRITATDGKPATLKIHRSKKATAKVTAVRVHVDGEGFARLNLGVQGTITDEQLIKNLAETDVIGASNVAPTLAPASVDAGNKPKTEKEAKAATDAGERAGTVSIPPSVDALLTQAMEAQKGRITRLRNQAKADGTTLEERKAANLKVLAAEATLRKMRTTRFDAEDAVAAAMKSGNAEDARPIEDLFPKAFAEVEALLAKADTPPDQSKARAQSQVLEQPAQDRYPAPSIKQQRSNDWPSASDGWQMVGGSREAPGSASEKSAKIELGKNPEWAARGAVILPFAYNDGGVFGLSKYGETSTRYAILVREEKYTPPEKPEASNFDQKTLVDKSYLFEKPGDVGIVVGNGRVRFVSMSDAIAAVREALGSGTRPTPFQIHNATGIRLGDVDGVLNAMKAEAVAPVRKTVESEQATDLDAMFDDVLAEEVAKDEAKNAKPTNLKQAITQQRAKRAPRTATQAATSAAKNTASALGNAIDGLGALFGGNGKLGSGLSFDEQTYAKAKPLFQAAVANLGEAGRDMKEAMRAVVRMVMDKFGAQAAQNMKPYVVRFIEDTSQGDVPVKAETLTAALYQAIKANQIPKDNPALKKLVEAFDGKPADPARMKQAQEELETAIAMMARELVANNEGDRTTFDTLLRLYENQPNLNIRTSTSIANQAYSTPAPLAYLASRLAGITKSTVAHEPTAGTGMLLIGADPKKAIVNELNDLRIEALKSQGFAPTQKDAATQQLVPDGQQPDAIVTNPPFGSIKDADGSTVKVKVDGFSLGQIDHLIAARALNTMKQDGRATLILGANKVAGGLSTDDRIFFNWLYSHYNVVGHFEIEGDLYNRQGAGWPVRVITINGRVKSNKISPVAGIIQRVNNWDAVYEQFTQSLAASKDQVSVITPTAGDGAGARPVGPVATPGQADKGGPNGSPRRDGDVPGAGTGVLSDSTEPAAGAVGDSADEQRLNAQSFVPATQPGQNPDGAERSAKPAGTDPVAEAHGNEFQLPYTPRSARKDEGVLIPANMAQPTQDALSRLEDEVGDIDEFARKELGYDTVADLHGALMGLQVDSVATSIYQIKQGKAVVIADQTGIGKGRQAASIIRWAALQGMTPVFVSVKPSLFTDMYGDLADIGTTDVTPFIMNSDAWVAGDGGSKLFANKSAGHKNVIQEIANSGQLPDGSNALFMTYSQINVANVQRQALMALAPNAVFILDESHNAAGASATGDFVIGALGAAKGVVYLSATYAKRPDNMPLYFKTDIGEAAADTDGLADAMASGGLPLQTVVSNNLVKAGQMFRRERSYDGVSIASVFDTPNRSLHERMSDEATKALRAIVSADRMFHEVYVKSLAKRLALEGATVQDNAGNQIERGVQHTEFSSVVHNFVKQMLLGLKAQSAADEAIASLKRGEKPIIAVENTMGSFLNEYAASNGIGQGDSLGTFDYRTVLSRALARSRVIVEVAPNGDKVKRPVSMAELDEVTQASYRAAQAVIDGLTLSIPVSPIDWVRAEIARAGYKVAEITGRNLSVDYGDPRKPVLSAIDAAEQKDKVNTTRQFNSGNLDALILNVAGSTGISLHASEKFEDQRQRHMIVAQAAGDINIFMQMLGRVHRTGQVRLPKYTILSVDLPTEKRPTAVLSIKMKSLNANTSSNTESATSVKSSDILNKYGDQIVNQYLSDNYALARALGIEQEIGTDPSEDIARKATGRLALQPIEVQTGFYEEVESQYEALIDYLNKTNQNDLEPRTFDFDAKETRQEVLFDGPNKNTPFGEDAIYGEYSIKAQGEPMKPAEIKAVIAENLSGKTGQAHANALVDTLLQTYADQMNAGREKAGLVPGKFDEAKYTAFMKGLYGEEGAAWWVSNAKAAIAKGQDVALMTREQMANVQGSAAGIEFIRSHPIGKTFRVDINSEPFNAVVTGIRSTHKSTGNPFSLSKIQVTVAVNGALRSLSIPATQFRKIEVSSIAPGFQIEQLFREQPPNQRETAKIVTGNLLAAYGELQGVRGTIITFTKQDGTSEQGILLPKLFDYSKNTRGDYRLQDGQAALKFLQQSENKDIGRFGIMTRDGEVRVLPAARGIRVQVPKSKLKGAKYFLDKGLIAVGGDFVSQGSFMVSVVYNPSDAVKMLDLLMKKQALYAMPSMAEEAKALTGSQDEKPAASRTRPVFSRAAQGQASGVVQSIVDAITARWANAPKVVVAFDMNDPAIPERVRQEDQRQRSGGATGTPEGFYYKGTVYLMSSKLANPRDVVRVLLHESLGHFGLRGVFGKELKPLLQQIATMRKSQIEAKMKEYGLRGVSNVDRLVAAEEVLAEMAQTSPQIGFVRRAVATIKAWLRKHVPGFGKMVMTDDEIITNFILPARNYVVNGGSDGGPGGGVRFSRKTDIQAARKALEKIMRNGVTSPDDLQALLRVPGYSKWAKSTIAGDMESATALRRELQDAFPGSDWKAPKLIDQGIITIYPDWVGLTSQSLDNLTKLADKYDTPIGVRGGAATKQLVSRLDGFGFELYNGLQERADRMPNVMFGMIRPAGGITATTPLFSRATQSPSTPVSTIRQAITKAYGNLLTRLEGKGLVTLTQTEEEAISAAAQARADQNGGDVEAIKNQLRGSVFASVALQTDSENFKRWFGDSQVVDATGKPLVVYHGTDSDFAEFKARKRGSNTGAASAKQAFWFSSSANHAGHFNASLIGNVVMPVYVSLQNPLIVDHSGFGKLEIHPALGTNAEDMRVASIKRAKKLGHDGVIFKNTMDTYAAHDDGTGAYRVDLYAIFDPAQIKSAIGNNGDFDGNNPDIRFSRSMGEALNAGVNNVRDMKLPAGYKVNDLIQSHGKLGWWSKTVGTQYHLAQKSPAFKRVFDSAQGFLNDVSYYASEAANAAPTLLPKLETLKDLGKQAISAADNKAIAAPIFEGTLVWGRSEDGRAVKLADENDDTLTPGVVFTADELRLHFELTDRQIALYQEFRAATDKSLTNMGLADMVRFGGKDLEAVADEVLSAENFGQALAIAGTQLRAIAKAEPKRAAVLLDTMGKMAEKVNKYQGLVDKGYAPLSRFGRHTLDVLDDEGERVYFGLFESEAESNKMARQMQANYPGAQVSQGTVSEEEHKLFAGVSPETVELFGEMLGLEGTGDEAADMAFQQYLKMAKANRSAMKRLIHRKGIAGFSEDPGRVLAGFVYSNARQTSSAVNMGELTQAVAAIPKGQGELKDHAVRLHNYVKNPIEEAQAFRGLLFAQYIGGSVASAIINTTQPFAVTMPWLSQFGGVSNAAKQMGAAVKDALKGSTGDAVLDKALLKAEEDGIVSPQEVFQLQAQAAGRATLKAGDGTKMGDAMATGSNALSKLGIAWGQLFGLAEQFNRRTTFIAAYRTAVEQGMPNPSAFAERAISETQFIYSKANKPRWARGAIGATLFTFKQYSISYVELMHRMATQGGPEGKRAALLGLAILFLLSGAGGLPFAEDVDDVIDGIMQRMGYNFSTKQAKQEFFAGVLGEDGAKFMMRGVSGLAGVPVDVSGRFGMGNLIPATGLLTKKTDYTSDFMELAGPAGDMVRRTAQAGEKLARGEVFGAQGALATAAPLAGQNVVKAMEMANTGMYLDKKGRKVLDVDGYDAAMKVIGFQPNQIAAVQDATYDQQRMVGVNRMREAEIADKWARGLFLKDAEMVTQARADLAQWNADNPMAPIQIKMPQVLRRVHDMNMTKAERVAKAAPQEVRVRVREELRMP